MMQIIERRKLGWWFQQDLKLQYTNQNRNSTHWSDPHHCVKQIFTSRVWTKNLEDEKKQKQKTTRQKQHKQNKQKTKQSKQPKNAWNNNKQTQETNRSKQITKNLKHNAILLAWQATCKKWGFGGFALLQYCNCCAGTVPEYRLANVHVTSPRIWVLQILTSNWVTTRWKMFNSS